MSRFNASDWALRHRSLVVFLMAVCAIAGAMAFAELGRDEDPPFTIKTMVVKTLWPGATPDETLNQVTDRIEKKLEEIPSLDYLQSYTTAGESVVFVTLKDSTPPAAVADIWYQVRKKTGDIVQTLPQGAQGPFFNDEFGDTFGVIYGFTSDGFSPRELKDYVEGVRAELLRLPDVGKIDLIGVQDEQVTIAFSPRKLANLGIGQGQVLEALRAQNAVAPSGTVDTGAERILLRVSGGFHSEADIADINLRANGRFVRLAEIAEIHRGLVDPPQQSYRVGGKPAIGLALSMVKGGDNLRLGDNLRRRMAELERDRPLGIEAVQVANQPEVVRASVHGFVKSLAEAVVIVLAVSFLSLGFRAGTVVALSIPLVLGMTFVGMKLCGIDLQRVSLGALIIALGLLVDDAMITIEMMVKKQEDGHPLREAATFAFKTTAFPMLTGTLVTVIGFVPVGFARSASGEYCFSLFAVVTIALIAGSRPCPWRNRHGDAGFARLPHPAGPLPAPSPLDHRRHGGAVPVVAGWRYPVAAAILPALGSARSAGQPDPAAQRLDPRHRLGGGPIGEAIGRGRRYRQLCRQCRQRRGAVLPAARRPARPRLFRPSGGGGEKRRLARRLGGALAAPA